jgi:LPS sulfotransferase NodH
VSGVAPPFVTVVSGVPRSGTSLMMSMLVAGGLSALKDDVRAADEDNPRGYYELEAVKRLKDDPTWVAGAVGRVVKVVHVHVRNLPVAGLAYRVVLMKRDLGEVLRSQKKMLARRGQPGGNLTDERIAALYAKQLADLESWMATQPAFSFLVADYNRLLKDPRPVVAEINRFLGGGLDESAMLAQIDPGLYRS